MDTQATTTPRAPSNVADPVQVQAPAVTACLRALSARWSDATFDVGRTDDGTAYGHFWSPSPPRRDGELSVIVEPAPQGGWRAWDTAARTPLPATGRTMADCLDSLAALLDRSPAMGLLLGARAPRKH